MNRHLPAFSGSFLIIPYFALWVLDNIIYSVFQAFSQAIDPCLASFLSFESSGFLCSRNPLLTFFPCSWDKYFFSILLSSTTVHTSLSSHLRGFVEIHQCTYKFLLNYKLLGAILPDSFCHREDER